MPVGGADWTSTDFVTSKQNTLLRRPKLIAQSESENVAAGGNRHILLPADRIAHRGGMDLLAGVEVPTSRTGAGVYGLDHARVIALG